MKNNKKRGVGKPLSELDEQLALEYASCCGTEREIAEACYMTVPTFKVYLARNKDFAKKYRSVKAIAKLEIRKEDRKRAKDGDKDAINRILHSNSISYLALSEEDMNDLDTITAKLIQATIKGDNITIEQSNKLIQVLLDYSAKTKELEYKNHAVDKVAPCLDGLVDSFINNLSHKDDDFIKKAFQSQQ